MLELQNPLTLSVADAVRLSGLKRTSLYAAMKDGRLRYSHVGRRRLVHFESLRRLVGVADAEQASP
jgi:hypothetical protein